ncbi:WYL domain-containing protein [Sporosarcina cyprini]|uniref:WYL domain-containing protein n=1 Tax=Sporosarcina cyprini TaxID=2910523 RepID=UPI001EE04DCD|nr:WYL domain-containing protein [Sporosarcina cyprini]MCG3087649.1 WYL domain-containing protein [Sporosarcina cyprini]
MRNELLKLCERHELADMIYMRADGQLTKRRVEILSIGVNTFIAYCFLRKERRMFKIDRVLSVQRVLYRESAAM